MCEASSSCFPHSRCPPAVSILPLQQREMGAVVPQVWGPYSVAPSGLLMCHCHVLHHIDATSGEFLFFFSYVPTVYRTGMVLGDGCPLQGAELHSQAVNQPSAWIPWPLSHQLHTSLCSQDASWKAERLKKICLNANKQCIVPVVPDPAAGICV